MNQFITFDVLRHSDMEAGRIGAQATCPLEGAVFDEEKQRWILCLSTAREVFELARKVNLPLCFHPHHVNDEELPILEVCDVDPYASLPDPEPSIG